MLTVRTFEAADLPVLWTMAVLPNLGATADPSVPVPLPAASVPPAQFGDLADPATTFAAGGGDFVVAELDGHIVGMGGFRAAASPGRAEVLRVRVHPARRRRGIGRELMAALKTRAAHRRFQETWLDTATNQPEAMAFYQSLGYLEAGPRTPAGIALDARVLPQAAPAARCLARSRVIPACKSPSRAAESRRIRDRHSGEYPWTPERTGVNHASSPGEDQAVCVVSAQSRWVRLSGRADDGHR